MTIKNWLTFLEFLFTNEDGEKYLKMYLQPL